MSFNEIRYDDILKRIDVAPLWWVDGVPRFEPFHPSAAVPESWQIALVRMVCLECTKPYDVAVCYPGRRLRLRMVGDLRDQFDYDASLDTGWRPNGCARPGCLQMYQVAILEFWEREPTRSDWRRDSSMERLLGDADWDGSHHPDIPKSAGDRLRAEGLAEQWQDASKAGDLEVMTNLLAQVGCERSHRAAIMVDAQRKYDALWREVTDLYKGIE